MGGVLISRCPRLRSMASDEARRWLVGKPRISALKWRSWTHEIPKSELLASNGAHGDFICASARKRVDNPAVSAMELALALAVMERAPVFEGRAGGPWVYRAVNRGLFSGRLVIRPVE